MSKKDKNLLKHRIKIVFLNNLGDVEALNRGLKSLADKEVVSYIEACTAIHPDKKKKLPKEMYEAVTSGIKSIKKDFFKESDKKKKIKTI